MWCKKSISQQRYNGGGTVPNMIHLDHVLTWCLTLNYLVVSIGLNEDGSHVINVLFTSYPLPTRYHRSLANASCVCVLYLEEPKYYATPFTGMSTFVHSPLLLIAFCLLLSSHRVKKNSVNMIKVQTRRSTYSAKTSSIITGKEYRS